MSSAVRVGRVLTLVLLGVLGSSPAHGKDLCKMMTVSKDPFSGGVRQLQACVGGVYCLSKVGLFESDGSAFFYVKAGIWGEGNDTAREGNALTLALADGQTVELVLATDAAPKSDVAMVVGGPRILTQWVLLAALSSEQLDLLATTAITAVRANLPGTTWQEHVGGKPAKQIVAAAGCLASDP